MRLSQVINKRNLEVAHENGQRGNSSFNCWGATLFVLGVIKDLYWADNEEIADFVDEHTYKVNKPKSGDLLILRYTEGGRIMHSGLYIDSSTIFHKRGANQSEYTNIDGVLDIYWEAEEFEIRRINWA